VKFGGAFTPRAPFRIVFQMRTITIAAALALLSACSRNPTSQPMDSPRPDASKPESPKKEETPGVKKYPVSMSDEEWRQRLTPDQYEVCRRKGTERPFGKAYEEVENQGKGTYACSACGQTLFASETKFHSGTGWPSFYAPKSEKSVEKIHDLSYGMDRVEVVCSNCGAHLGHVFDDGPRPTGLRFCMNSVSLQFVEEKKEKQENKEK
jgi:peptide-methionine (R)-S-oxide reductase